MNALDASEGVIKEARKLYQEIQLYQMDILQEILDDKFDLIVISGVIQYLDKPTTALKRHKVYAG